MHSLSFECQVRSYPGSCCVNPTALSFKEELVYSCTYISVHKFTLHSVLISGLINLNVIGRQISRKQLSINVLCQPEVANLCRTMDISC